MTTNRSWFCRPSLLLIACVLLVFSTSALAQGVSQQQVDLSSVYNVNGINNDGTAVANGGFDNDGYAYSAQAMAAACPPGTSGCSSSYPTLAFTEGTNTVVNFQFGPANQADAVTGHGLGPINLPQGAFTELQMLGAGVNGTQSGQSIVINYSDGSSVSASQSFGDWYGGHCTNTGESPALIPAYRLNTDGSKDARAFYICLYNIALDPTKTVSTLVLPSNRNVVILAATLVAIPGFATAAGSPSASTVAPGSSITIPATATSEAGYNGTVNLTCTVSPAIQSYQAAKPPTCTLSPTSVGVAVGVPGTSTVTFSPASPASARLNSRSSLMYALWLPVSGVFLAGMRSRSSRRKRMAGLAVIGLLLVGIFLTPGCVSYTHLGNVGTPPGQYTISITGTDSATNSPQLGTGGSVVVTVQQ